MKRRAVFAAVAVVLSLGATPLASQDGIDCQRCHGELELLRQYVESLQEARSLRVSSSMLQGSAHGQLECTECHSGFSRFPHGDQAITASCGSCHEAVAGAWETGLHGGSDGTEGVPCAACHGIHDVVPVDSLDAGPALAAMSETCVGCHETQRLPVEAHHQDHAGCYDCHDPHGTGSADDPESRIAPLNQPRTCGARMLRQGEWEGGEPPPTCTACHGAHPVAGADDRGFAAIAIEKCAGCHEKAAETYRRSYHGKATELGSEAAATCAECHGAHDMLPGSDPASRVSDANLVATCGECHEHARPAFVEYDTHPEPMNRERNPAIFYSFWFMNTLLIGTLTVFGLHTLLWWVRISIDRRKEAGHEGGGGE
jgi:hypothetical protein